MSINKDLLELDSKLFIKTEIESEGHELCRLCVENSLQYSSIFLDNLHLSLRTYLGLQIEETDNWPKFICRKCFDTANVCVEFISTIRESEFTLKNIYGDLRDLDTKPGIEIVDIRSLPQYEFDELKREEVTEEVPARRRSLRRVVKEPIKPKKRGRPRKHKISDENLEKDGSNAVSLEANSSNLIVKSSPVSDSQPESPFVQNDASEDEEIEEEPEKITRKKLDASEYRRKVEEFFKMDCDICDQSCNTLPNLQNHYRTVHKRKGYVVCCNVKLNRQSKVLQHLEFHKNPNAFQCSQCSKTFKNKEGLQLHTVNSHTPKELHKYKCSKCPKTFMSSFRFNAHSHVHVTEEEKDQICPHCNKAFPAKVNLRNHIKNMHEEVDYHVCEICAKMFKSKDFLRHLATHSNEKIEKTLPCPICGKLFRYKSQLNHHIERHNDSGQVFRCHLCKKEAPNKSALQKHIRFVHIREKKHKCNLCESAFKTPLGLREHMATHTSNQILYTCLFCPKQFNSNANKYVHQKRKHPVEYEAMKNKKETGNLHKMES